MGSPSAKSVDLQLPDTLIRSFPNLLGGEHIVLKLPPSALWTKIHLKKSTKKNFFFFFF